ncbi:alanine racemase [Sediminicola sp. YIK13]|uniref:D-TA family PLP-dependent enzyme n=1 Tax=Sediminicola sp. YIK13 TaxID=1453352 RepID=UPI00071F91A2|nr:D-TA family PLP-dependent enzyme [Sediminicola sp. YIK13]ALM07043.1 alanine racemase [Sediminicola sp. YIK13]
MTPGNLSSNWYLINNVSELDSPSIALYKDRLLFNIHKMKAMVGDDVSRLMPHVKTNKMPKVIALMISNGITRFKASTIAEAEMAAQEGAHEVLIAHQLVGPKVDRFVSLIEHYPNTVFSTLTDNIASAQRLNVVALNNKLRIEIFIDINNGMDRSGIEMGAGLDELLLEVNNLKNLYFRGLHVYDGHLRNSDFQKRKEEIEHGLKNVNALYAQLKKKDPNRQLICGGTPSFTAHLLEESRICSPGTCLFWDWGYGDKLGEQEFKYAALLITRVISKPKKGIITLDLGHKGIAAENPIQNRVRILNLSDYELLSQSEEHGVFKVKEWDKIKVGDVFYGVPYHICPTINLYDEAAVIENGNKVDTWQITARKRKINI